MKFIKTFIVGASLALGMAGLAQAASTPYYIAGSTAFRAHTSAAIMAALGSTNYSFSAGTGTLPAGTTSDTTPRAYGYAFSGAGTSLGGSNNALFIGTLSGTIGEVIIHTTWTGSESGIYSIAVDSGTGATVSFINEATTTVSTSGTNNATATLSHAPDAAMSDTYQATSQWAGGSQITYTGTASDGSTHTMGTATESVNSPVGITYFSFFVSKSGTAAGITNISAEQAKWLYKANTGKVVASFLNPSTTVPAAIGYAVGRNPDSGTRLTTMGEIGLGNLASVTQYYMYSSGSAQLTTSGSVAYIDLVPEVDVNQLDVGTGNSGFSSGGSLVTAVDDEQGPFSTTGLVSDGSGFVTPAGSFLIGYAGLSDLGTITYGPPITASKLTHGGQLLTFNGAVANDTNVQNGSYPLWTYEHLYKRNAPSGGPSVLANAVSDKIALQLKGTSVGAAPANSGAVTRTSMKVRRATGTKDGGTLIQVGTF